MFRRLLIAFTFVASAASADPMQFQAGGSDTRCRECAFVQASGEITPETPKAFLDFVAANGGGPFRVRLHSPGGNLQAGLELGRLFRQGRHDTEVGSDKTTPDGYPAFGGRSSERRPGICASACAYAFLGGVERTLDDGSKLGVHRFYRADALQQPTEKLFTGGDLDNTQKRVAALVLYMIQMGVDARLVTFTADAGPDEMRWIDPEEAKDLRVIYEPEAWRPWRVEPFRDGAIAISETNNSVRRMVVSCTRRFGPQMVLTDTSSSWDVAGWFEQNKTCPFEGKHPILGTLVDPARVQVIRRNEGGAIMRFKLPTNNPPLTSASVMGYNSEAYPSACSSWNYEGTTTNIGPTVRLALKNCFSD